MDAMNRPYAASAPTAGRERADGVGEELIEPGSPSGVLRLPSGVTGPVA